MVNGPFSMQDDASNQRVDLGERFVNGVML